MAIFFAFFGNFFWRTKWTYNCELLSIYLFIFGAHFRGITTNKILTHRQSAICHMFYSIFGCNLCKKNFIFCTSYTRWPLQVQKTVKNYIYSRNPSVWIKIRNFTYFCNIVSYTQKKVLFKFKKSFFNLISSIRSKNTFRKNIILLAFNNVS